MAGCRSQQVHQVSLVAQSAGLAQLPRAGAGELVLQSARAAWAPAEAAHASPAPPQALMWSEGARQPGSPVTHGKVQASLRAQPRLQWKTGASGPEQQNPPVLRWVGEAAPVVECD